MRSPLQAYLDIGYTVGNATASHGFCIGSWMRSGTFAELYVHGTAPASVSGQVARSVPIGVVQRGNYATAFRLAHLFVLRGIGRDRFRWLGLRGFISDRALSSVRRNGRTMDNWRGPTPPYRLGAVTCVADDAPQT